MDNLINNATVSLPQVFVTEPSPVSVQTESAMSIVSKIKSTPEVAANGETQESKQSLDQAAANGETRKYKQSLDQAAATSVPSANFANGATSESVQESLEQVAATSGPNANFASGEIVPAQECNECIVSVPEEPPSQQFEDAASTTVTPQLEPDFYFGTADDGCCTNCGICTLQCLIYYQKAWDTIHSKYALPIWLLLLALPLSAGYMGALNMYSCPAYHSLPMLKFLIGICLIAELSFRICLIIRIMTISEGESWGSKLNILLLASSFLTVVFFVTEAMLFWKMETTTHTRPGMPDYCDPHFVTFSFWWNCVMSVVIVPIFLFPS